MVTIFLTFLRKYWQYFLLAAVVGGGWMYYNHLTSTIATQEQTISRLTLENTVVKENNDKLQASIEASNKSIELLAKGAADTKQGFVTLNNTVRTQTSSLNDKLENILADPKPQTCEDTIKYLIDAVKEYP